MEDMEHLFLEEGSNWSGSYLQSLERRKLSGGCGSIIELNVPHLFALDPKDSSLALA